MGAWGNDVRRALRTLTRARAYAATVIAMIALGVAAAVWSADGVVALMHSAEAIVVLDGGVVTRTAYLSGCAAGTAGGACRN